MSFSSKICCPLLLAAVGFCLGGGETFAGNPLVQDKGLADPHGLALGDRVYLFATHDFSPQNRGFVMKDWWVWSSADLVNWVQESTLHPEDTYLRKPFNNCWATFGVYRNDKFYWYFSAGQNDIGVAVADSAKGPWKDPLGKPLLAKGLTPTEQRDPDILLDDDGKAYMIYGTFHYFIARLGDDMISLAETPRAVQLDRQFGPYGEGKTDDKPSLHKHNGIYYLSWSSFYATSKDLYGPYVFKGCVIDSATVAPDFQHQKLVQDRHGNFFEFNHQCYYTCNDMSQPGHSKAFRDAIMTYVHYRDDGEIAPVRIDRVGVGQYDADQPRIEAEEYFNVAGAEKRESQHGGFEMRGLREGSYLLYPKVMNVPANAQVSFCVSSAGPGGATLEVREGGPEGNLLGSCQIASTGRWDQYRNCLTGLRVEAGTHDLCFVVHGGADELMRLDWFAFSKPPGS